MTANSAQGPAARVHPDLGGFLKCQIDLPTLEGRIISFVAKAKRVVLESDLDNCLLDALRQALESERLDVADLVLQALELYDGREAVAAYDLLAEATPPSLRRP